ncbi:MAG: hypothetical protein RI897_704 [Verrucomicrobiota bacterium]
MSKLTSTYRPCVVVSLFLLLFGCAVQLLTVCGAEVQIQAGEEWVPVVAEREIEAGSALDWSGFGFVDAPAGKFGRVIATPEGQFAFEQRPNEPQRFYGVNLCFGAHYLTHEEADQLAERLVRLGYNTLRIHHYERDLVGGQAKSTTLDPEKLDQLDYLCAALIRRGIYLTTDLFVSRPVPYREIGEDRDGQVPMDTFKILVPVHEGAYENWQAFARNLLAHVNPYTGRSYAAEPALGWLSMINEGIYGNFIKDLREIPQWKLAWNAWLAARYDGEGALKLVWGGELQATESLEQKNIELPANLRDGTLRARDCVLFFSETERKTVVRMKRFVREELGCGALISNANSWTYFVTDQGAREVYDYVDDHFYVDHPQFLERSWRLPSRCPNTSPIAGGAAGGRSKSFTRLLDKPFTITEYNYSGPGRFRGIGGILTGAMGAIQNWSGIWRFAYSHSREAMFRPGPINYFDLANDPLSQAAERASLCLFLRGDMRPATRSLALVMTEADLAHPPSRIRDLHPQWHWAAWVTRVGTDVLRSPAEAGDYSAVLPVQWSTKVAEYPKAVALPQDPYAIKDEELVGILRKAGSLGGGNRTDPARKVFQSETGEITIDGERDMLVLDTERTAGGYAVAGSTILAGKGGVEIKVLGADATVWLSSLDGEPIRSSNRMLVTHLTDLQNTGIRYAEEERKTLLAWGQLPSLVRNGQAEVVVQLDHPERYVVWALSQGGRRLAEVPGEVKDGGLRFVADVDGNRAEGARMLYEIAVQ